MALIIHKRCEITFRACHPLGPKLGLKTVAKVVKCDKMAHEILARSMEGIKRSESGQV